MVVVLHLDHFTGGFAMVPAQQTIQEAQLSLLSRVWWVAAKALAASQIQASLVDTFGETKASSLLYHLSNFDTIYSVCVGAIYTT